MILEEARAMLERVHDYHDLTMPGVVVLDGHFSLLELKAIYTVAMDLWLKDLGEGGTRQGSGRAAVVKEPLELMGIAEIATHFGVTRQVVNNWKVRYPHFPKPIARLGKRTAIWARRQILKWDPPKRWNQ